MGEIADRIDALLAARRERLPGVRDELARWDRVDAAVAGLADAVAALRRHPATPPAAAARLDELRVGDLRPALAAATEPLRQVERRIGRGRLCIGVGGAGRSGASTLVRSLSGLADAWLPTGGDGPVTAVRTRVLHSPDRRRAVLVPHTVDTFRAAHPADGHVDAALWSSGGLLDRHGRPLELAGDDLDRLREYVTHAGTGAAGNGTAAARAASLPLAVREARIEIEFPHAEVAAIEFVDLPALAATGRHHVAGLRHELDLALLVTRPSGRSDADAAALAVLDEPRGNTGRRDDFVLVVHNTSSGEPGPATALQVDARDPDDVADRLLGPVLRHLAARLAAMDADALATARSHTDAVRDQLIDLAVAARVVLDRAGPPPDGSADDLYRSADELHATVAGALRAALAAARGRAGTPDPELVSAADGMHAGLVAWIRDGLGVGPVRWCAAARRAAGSGEFVAAELDRIRREIDHRCRATLDPLLSARLAAARADVAGALSPLGTSDLGELDRRAAGAGRPCHTLRAAIADLLAVRLDHHGQLAHRIRPDLAELAALTAFGPAHDVTEAYGAITGRAELAADRVRDRLRAEAATPGWILLTAVERFADAMLGSGERDIRQLARTYRHDLWPGRYHGLNRDDAQVVRTGRAADELLAALADPET